MMEPVSFTKTRRVVDESDSLPSTYALPSSSITTLVTANGVFIPSTAPPLELPLGGGDPILDGLPILKRGKRKGEGK